MCIFYELKPFKIIKKEEYMYDVLNKVYGVNYDKLKSLGWDSVICWEDGIDKTIKWITDNPSHWDIYEKTKICNIKTFKDIRGELKFINLFNQIRIIL